MANKDFQVKHGLEVVEGSILINSLSASSILETDGSKILTTVSKNSAYNKNFGGTGSATTVSRSDHTHSYLPLSGGTLTGNLYLGDNDHLYLGTGNDLDIYFDGSRTYLMGWGQVDFGTTSAHYINFKVTDITRWSIDESGLYPGSDSSYQIGATSNRPSYIYTDNIDTPKIGNLTSNGFVKTSGSDGTLSVDTTTYSVDGHTHSYDNYGGWDLYVGGTGITIAHSTTNTNTVTISHSDTSTQSSLTALTGANVVSDIDLDTYGHVTNLATRDMTEDLQDLVGAMINVSSAQSGMGITYNDTSGQIDFDLSHTHSYDNYGSWTFEAKNSAGTSLGSSAITSGDTAVIKAGTGITLSWADDEITVTNASPDVNHNVSTNLSTTHNASTVVINSSDGTDATINAATATTAGIMSEAMFDAYTLNNTHRGLTNNPHSVVWSDVSTTALSTAQTWTAKQTFTGDTQLNDGDIAYYGTDSDGVIVWDHGTNTFYLQATASTANVYIKAGASGKLTLAAGTHSWLIDDSLGCMYSAGVNDFGRTSNRVTNIYAANVDTTKIGNLTSNGFVKTSGGDGTLSVDTNTYLTSETSHADVLVDGDFTSEGLMKRGASAGLYSIVTDNSTNWNSAYSHTSLTNNPHSVTASQLGLGTSDDPQFESLTLGGTERLTSKSDCIEIAGGTSSYLISVQDGNGRIQHKWNATEGTSETYVVGPTEGALKWDMDTTVPTTDLWRIFYGSGGTAGTAISWSTIMSIGTTTFQWNGNNVIYAGESTYNNSNWDTAYNDKINSASFNTGDGVLTLTQQDAGTVTVDLDGRYIEGITAGSLIDVSGTATITVDVDLTELTTSTTNGHGDYFVVTDATGPAQYKLTKANIALSGFNNDSGWTNNTGTVTSVGTNTGLSGTVTTSGNLSLSLNSLSEKTGDLVATDRLIGVSGSTHFAETISEIPLSIFDNDQGWTSNAGTVTSVSGGTGLTSTGGTAPTINHSNSVSADTAEGTATSTLSHGGTFTVPTVTYDAQGHIISWSTNTLTLPSDNNTTNFNIQANAGTQVNISAGEEINFINGNATTAVVVDQANPTVTFNHNDTSTQASLTALTGANVVSDIDLDTYGHVTNIATRAMTLADLSYSVPSATLTAGTGLSGTTYNPSTSTTFSLDFSELTDMTADISGTTEFILQNGTTESRKAASEIKLSNFNNDSSWISASGTLTNAITFNNGGSGAASGTTYNNSAARTISYNTIGAAASAHTHAGLKMASLITGTYYVCFAELNDGGITEKSISNQSNLIFDSSTGTLTATTFSGALSGNASTASQVYINDDDTGDTNCPILFTANSTAGNKAIYEDSAIYIDNTANAIHATTFVGALTGTASGNLVTNSALGTPASGNLANCIFPTLNQNTSGTAAYATQPYVTETDASGTFSLTFRVGATSAYTSLYSDSDANYAPDTNTLTVANFSGALSGNATTATTATNVTATANNSTNETVYLTFVDGATGTQGIETDTGLIYNPSTGLLSTTAISIPASGGLYMGDNASLAIGTGNDLQMYHDGTASYLLNTVGTFYIQTGASKYAILCVPDGAVSLYHNHALKLATTSTGIDVTGNITISGTVDGKDVSTLTSNTGTVTSVGGTGTVSGLTLSGSVSTTGNLTLGGAITGFSTTSHQHKYMYSHNYTIPGDLEAGDLVGFFVPVMTGTTVKVTECRYQTLSGSATVTLKKNGTGLTGFTSMSVTTTAASTDPTDQTLADNDFINVDIDSTTSGQNLTVSIYFEVEVTTET